MAAACSALPGHCCGWYSNSLHIQSAEPSNVHSDPPEDNTAVVSPSFLNYSSHLGSGRLFFKFCFCSLIIPQHLKHWRVPGLSLQIFSGIAFIALDTLFDLNNFETTLYSHIPITFKFISLALICSLELSCTKHQALPACSTSSFKFKDLISLLSIAFPATFQLSVSWCSSESSSGRLLWIPQSSLASLFPKLRGSTQLSVCRILWV